MSADHEDTRFMDDRSGLAMVEEQIVTAARALGITRITYHPTWEGLPWTSWRERKNAGASGPRLDDTEAAVLIAAGLDYSVAGGEM